MKKYFMYGHKVTEFTESNIYILEDFLTENKCKEFINYINTLDYTDKNIIEGINYVECYNLRLDDLKKNEKNIMIYTKHLYYDYKIYSMINEIIRFINKINSYISCDIDSGYGLRKVYGRTAVHVDGINAMLGRFNNFTRHLSIIIALNDNFDGGIFTFPKQNISFKLKAGSVLLFPPYWTHPHEVSTITNGAFRYTINTWGMEKF